MGVEEKLTELGLELPSPAAPVGNYVPAVHTGNLVFLSGHGPVGKDRVITGKLGKDLTVEEGYEAAELVALGLLGSLKSGQRFIHLHAVLADLDNRLYTGHLIEGNLVLTTMEVVVQETPDIDLIRSYDEETDLELFTISERSAK